MDNDNENETNLDMPDDDYIMEYRRFQKGLQPYFAAVYSIFFVTGLSNFAVLYIMATVKKLRTVSTFQVFNLCLTGCLFTLTLPLVTYFTITKEFPLNETMCKVSRSLTTMTRLAGILFITLASIERYLGVCHPTRWKHIWTWPMVMSLTLLAWLLAILINSPISIYSGFLPPPANRTVTNNRCILLWPDMDHRTWTSHMQKIYVTSIFVALFVVPTLVIFYCYTRIVVRIKSAARRMTRYDDSAIRRAASIPSNNLDLDSSRGHSRMRNRRPGSTKRRKVNQTILILIAFYLLCWGPYWILILLKNHQLITGHGKLIYVLFNVLQFLPYLNCSLNPFLYGFMTANFKAVVKAKYGCCFRSMRRSSSLGGLEATTVNHSDNIPGLTFSRVTTFIHRIIPSYNSYKGSNPTTNEDYPQSKTPSSQKLNPAVNSRVETDRQGQTSAAEVANGPITIRSNSSYCVRPIVYSNVAKSVSLNGVHHLMHDSTPDEHLINQSISVHCDETFL